MARLYDRVMATGLGVLESNPAFASTVAEDVGGRLSEAVVVDITNVVEFYLADAKSQTADITESWVASDFPNIAPPFEVTWLESSVASHGISRNGLLVWAERAPGGAALLDPATGTAQDFGPDGGWVMRAIAVQELDTIRPPAPTAVMRWNWGVASNGQALVAVDGLGREIPNTYSVPLFDTGDETQMNATLLLWRILYPALLAFSFMHCKNVEVRTVEPPPLSNYLKKKGVKPKVRYHVLDIDPMKKTLKTKGRSGEVGLKNALHICRGHFATYTEDAPLFGKYVGTFWKPQHVRGSAKHGAVVKDYKVRAP